MNSVYLQTTKSQLVVSLLVNRFHFSPEYASQLVANHYREGVYPDADKAASELDRVAMSEAVDFMH